MRSTARRLNLLPFLAFSALVPLPAADLPTAAAVPPSPSSVSTAPLVPLPRLSHWPAITYPDERASVAFNLPVPIPGLTGTVGWRSAEALPITLPSQASAGGLLSLFQREPGRLVAEVRLSGQPPADLPLRLVPAGELWPVDGERLGQPVDEDGVPVVLLDRRHDAEAERRLALVAALRTSRGSGPALVVGWPAPWEGRSVWDGLPARVRAVDGEDLHPGAAAVVGLAKDQRQWGATPPRTIILAPGPRWQPDPGDAAVEERLFSALRTRCEALGTWPRLVLLLPPQAVASNRQALATERRERLRTAAQQHGWVVLDPEHLAGPAAEAQRLAEGAFAPVPVGPARDRLREALSRELER